jgi:hypothetical protein
LGFYCEYQGSRMRAVFYREGHYKLFTMERNPSLGHSSFFFTLFLFCFYLLSLSCFRQITRLAARVQLCLSSIIHAWFHMLSTSSVSSRDGWGEKFSVQPQSAGRHWPGTTSEQRSFRCPCRLISPAGMRVQRPSA